MAASRDVAATLRSRAPDLAATISRRHLAAHPSLVERFGTIAETRCAQDTAFHLQHMAVAISTGRPQLFDQYVAWATELLGSHGLDADDLHDHLRTTVTVIAEECGDVHGQAVAALVDRGHPRPAGPSPSPASELDPATDAGRLATDFLDLLLAGDRRTALTRILESADDGMPLVTLYLDVFTPCLREVGRLWQLGAISVAQEHYVTAATQLAMAQLYPRTFGTDRIGRTVVVASVGGELHEIGGRMVADLFELHGWDSHFLGANTPARDIAERVDATDADLLAISVTIPSHLDVARDVLAAVRTRDVPVIVGGRPFLQVPDLWQVLGADGSAHDAREAVALADSLLAGA